MEGLIYDIQRFSVHDGPGIRTVVFFKGCNLKCFWCHNPESISSKSQLKFLEESCIDCGKCFSVCPTNSHYFDEIKGKHCINFKTCIGCFKCVQVCYANACIQTGQLISTQKLLSIVLKEKLYFDNSRGGVTFSGGEAMLQIDFLEEVLKLCKENNIHTAVDTAGFVKWENFKKIIKYTDLFLYDVKGIDGLMHKNNTSVNNKLILENLKKLSEIGANIIVRVPVIKNYNNYEYISIIKELKDLNIIKVEVLEYHKLGEGKYQSYGISLNKKTDLIPSQKEIEKIKDAFIHAGFKTN
ncbi:MAG: glycyl-radical enzyme activating protein [Lachnospirales bacterium]